MEKYLPNEIIIYIYEILHQHLMISVLNELHLFTFQTPILVPIKIYNTFYYIFQNSGMFRNIN